MGGLPKKGGLGEFADLRGELGKKEGGVFLGRWGVDTPMHTMNVEPGFFKKIFPNLNPNFLDYFCHYECGFSPSFPNFYLDFPNYFYFNVN